MESNLSPDIINIINETANRTAKMVYAKLTQAKQEREESMFELRLYNTKLLLEHYRLFKEHADNAISELDDIDAEQITAIEIMDSMLQSPVDKGEIALESIRNSALRTKIVMEHIDAMLGIYEAYCEKSMKPEDYRRWDVINTLYVKDMPSSMTKMEIYEELSKKHFVSVRQIQSDAENGAIKLTALLFGIDGVRKFTQRNIKRARKETEEAEKLGKKCDLEKQVDAYLMGEISEETVENSKEKVEILQ